MDNTELIYNLTILAISVITIIAEWRMFTKAKEPGWAALIPLYDAWVLYRIICGRGKACLRLLIPIYNIYWSIKSTIKLAHAYGYTTAFGVFAVFFGNIAMWIMGFGKAEYEGAQKL